MDYRYKISIAVYQHLSFFLLYYISFQGGRPSKAIDLAFKTEQFSALQLISEDLDENADPEVLKKCAEFFIDHDQFDKAVNLLVVAKRVSGVDISYTIDIQRHI